ncbi:MAG: ATP-dependent Clp protease proteolytic subunit [Erysipelotrichaceae bacterium]
MNIIPTVIEKTSNHEYAYDLYSRLLTDRIIFITGEITPETSDIIISELLYLDSLNHNDISLYINSPGGVITAGMAIYDTMNFVKSDIVTIGIGICASMAAFLLSSGQKVKRYRLPNSEVMIHQPLGGAEGQATEIKIAAEHILKIKNKMNEILAKNTNQDIKKIELDTERDHFLNSSEAKKYGIIDQIL